MFLAIKRRIARMLCSPIIANAIFRWYGGQIPFRGMTINTDHPHVPRSVVPRLYWNLYESAEVDFVRRVLRPDLPVIELGSCIGVVASVVARRQDRLSRLVSVEANPHLQDIIRENVTRNVLGKELDVVAGAIDYSGAKTVRFSVSSDAVSSHVGETDGMDSYDVRALQLASLLEEQGIDGEYALICDIEGAEAEIVFSESVALHRCQQFIVELHPGRYGPWNTDIQAVQSALLDRHGFTQTARRGNVVVYERIAK